ncbi:bifunctional (p)ppGpp synthetase/guanosine-3',5'-bis(diphosphate) 3'-pyrophosphohydrolase [Corynebacterium hylobatis]|uniref:Bifunctional (P)ppGpp synthetase/guanosine-3',5'-bis(Diphosphate) 3'-pyrophosphohydrolase n=1 Tax=Corynebacterium hylobatis TaxID=1859290 RepID=A0A430I1S8_9CORY|nr:HD domain-containing protein [Corynebacterium hylobatis]RSZ66081.1 bifunctional (p)ppGpp synthetase/guanosine-3',5'-bis(diphosphate) 3'-pyrophosphohydrolase [Corynebacterium hylobatis]
MMLSHRLMHAMNTAAVNHCDQVRKGSGIPYIAHLYAVMHLVSQVTDDEDILIAALFHDTLEDVPENYPEARMRAEFGDRVTDIVLGLTKDDSLPDWQARADAYLEQLARRAPDESVLIACADKLHNLLSILDDHAILGEDLWARFNSGKQQQQWWYAQVNRVVEERLPGLALNRELARHVEFFHGL